MADIIWVLYFDSDWFADIRLVFLVNDLVEEESISIETSVWWTAAFLKTVIEWTGAFDQKIKSVSQSPISCFPRHYIQADQLSFCHNGPLEESVECIMNDKHI